ncbi:MAG: hypothetical protein D6698_05995 [Gammaproteobacteria bacterium]|nr:MAG: hypothetical protein D6698_05995 [Gammaproteobacteria bacterium]
MRQYYLNRFQRVCALLLGGIALACLNVNLAQAANFTLDFKADDTHDTSWAGLTNGRISCNFAGLADANCGQGAVLDTTDNDVDNTPFMLEKVTVAGLPYFHMVMGDPNADMAQEYYIRADGAGFSQQSASNGDGCYNNGAVTGCVQFGPGTGVNQVRSGNGWDPLALSATTTNANTGNGSANPNHVIMRQVTGNGTWDPVALTRTCTDSLCQEFLKATLAMKPKITQDLSSTHGGQTVTGQFVIDMSNSDYQTDTAQAAITNTLDFSASTAGNFNQATDAQNASVNGGQYTYTPGTVVNNCPPNCGPTSGVPPITNNMGAGGTFSKGIDPTTFDYGAFRDPSQNATGAGNLWKP